MAIKLSHPVAFSDTLKVFDAYAPFTDISALKEASARPLRKSVRVNLLKSSVGAFRGWAEKKGWRLAPVPWCAEGFFVEREDWTEALGKDLLHLLGHIYLQEAASMLPVTLLSPEPKETILDMAASPGSKTTQMASRMRNTGLIVANDVQEKRLWTLKSAINRNGVTNTIVTRKVGQWFSRQMTECFDRVLCDAPCTAQGTVRKDTDALLYASQENIGKMARLQRELLEAAVHAANVGGRIVYSTCTLTPEENEGVVLSILNKFRPHLKVIDPRGLGVGVELGRAVEDSFRVQEYVNPNPTPNSTPCPFLRLWPQTYDTEGFFCAVLCKTARIRAPERFPRVPFQEELLPQTRVREMASALEERYGASFLLEGDCLFERGNRVILSTEKDARFSLPLQDYALGMPFGRRLDSSRVRLDHDLVTLRGHLASRNTVTLSLGELDVLLDGKNSRCDPALRGDVILFCGGIAVGVGLAKEGILRNRFPRWVIAKS